MLSYRRSLLRVQDSRTATHLKDGHSALAPTGRVHVHAPTSAHAAPPLRLLLLLPVELLIISAKAALRSPHPGSLSGLNFRETPPPTLLWATSRFVTPALLDYN